MAYPFTLTKTIDILQNDINSLKRKEELLRFIMLVCYDHESTEISIPEEWKYKSQFPDSPKNITPIEYFRLLYNQTFDKQEKSYIETM